MRFFSNEKEVSDMIRNAEITVLKVGAQTNLSALNTSVCERLKSDGLVIMDCIGEKAAYISMKAAIYAKRVLPENQKLIINPGYVLLNTPDGERKAIRWTLEIQ